MKLALPKPWGRSVLLTAEPLHVPSNTDKHSIEYYWKKLETRLNRTAEALEDHFVNGSALDEWGASQKRPL